MLGLHLVFLVNASRSCDAVENRKKHFQNKEQFNLQGVSVKIKFHQLLLHVPIPYLRDTLPSHSLVIQPIHTIYIRKHRVQMGHLWQAAQSQWVQLEALN